jgi:hypothetical protein
MPAGREFRGKSQSEKEFRKMCTHWSLQEEEHSTWSR